MPTWFSDRLYGGVQQVSPNDGETIEITKYTRLLLITPPGPSALVNLKLIMPRQAFNFQTIRIASDKNVLSISLETPTAESITQKAISILSGQSVEFIYTKVPEGWRRIG